MRKAFAVTMLIVSMSLGALNLSACGANPSGAPATATLPLSPREQAQQVDLAWAGIQAAVETAVTSPLLASKPDVKTQLKASSHAASAAVTAFHDAAAKCFRDPATGVVGNAPGQVCDMSAVTVAAAEAQTLLDQTSALSTAFGFAPATSTPAATATSPPATN